MDVRPAAYINGTWQAGEERVTVTDSANGAVIGELTLGTAEQASAAIEASHDAFAGVVEHLAR